MAYRSSSTASGNSTAPAVAVPAGAQAGDGCIAAVNVDSGSATITYPSGFTSTGSDFGTKACTAEGQRTGTCWKVLDAADISAGTISFSISGAATDWVSQAALLSGRDQGAAPVATVVTQNTLQSSPVTINFADVTAVAGDDAVVVSGLDVNGNGIVTGPANQTMPTNYTKRVDTENAWANLAIGTRDNLSAGATGALTGAVGLNSGACGYNTLHILWAQAAVGGGGGVNKLIGKFGGKLVGKAA